MTRKLILAAFALLLTTGISSTAHADILYYNLDMPTQTANPGDTVDMYAQIAEGNGDAVFLNGDSFSVDVPLILDDSGLFLNFDQLFFPYQFEDNILFTLTLPLDIPSGTYLGSFLLYGGSGPDDQDLISEQDFSITTVNTAPPLSGVPEPSSLLLLGTGFTAVIARYRKRT